MIWSRAVVRLLPQKDITVMMITDAIKNGSDLAVTRKE